MDHHLFLFTSGKWLGQGKVKLSVTDEELAFFTRWKISPADDSGQIECVQEIQIAGMSETMFNEFVFYDIAKPNFHIELENQNLGRVIGSGVLNHRMIAWEFRLAHLGFEGFEFYERDGEENYKMHAEYATNDEMRTVIHGSIWHEQQNTNQEKD